MRKILRPQIRFFLRLFGCILFSGIATSCLLIGALPLGDFRGVAVVLGAGMLIYLYAFAVYRIFLRFMPLREGELVEGSREEFVAQVNILFYLMIFNSLIRTHFLPVPLMRPVYKALGMTMGKNSHSAGAILDPPLTEIGDNCIIGHGAVLYAHAIEGRYFALSRIRIGDNVTIGAAAVIMPGVRIGDGAIVSAGAVVSKDTQIGSDEVWGGVPAKRIK